MVKVTILPDQPNPSLPTARVSPDTLGEHLRAFLNANNASGFLGDEIVTTDTNTVSGLLLSIMATPGMYGRDILQVVETLRDMTAKSMSRRMIKHVISHALGYRDLTHITQIYGQLGRVVFIPNISDQKLRNHLFDVGTRVSKVIPTQPTVHVPDFTESIDDVKVVDIMLAGVLRDIEKVRTLTTKNPAVKKLAVTLTDSTKVNILVDREIHQFTSGDDTHESISATLAMTFTNHNRREPLSSSEYFHRKIQLSSNMELIAR